MIVAKQAITSNDIELVVSSMPLFGSNNAIFVFGFWKDDKCIGGTFLSNDAEQYLVMEFYESTHSIIVAIANAFEFMLKHKKIIHARIKMQNKKSIKIAKMLGFKKIYNDGDVYVFQFSSEHWNYKKKYPLIID